jgi:hypothetical protein
LGNRIVPLPMRQPSAILTPLDRAVADEGVVADNGQSVNLRPFADPGRQADHRLRMNAYRPRRLLRAELGHDLGECRVHVGDRDPGQTGGFIAFGDDDGRSLTAGQLGGQLGTVAEGDFSRPGGRESRRAVDRKFPIAHELAIDQLSDLGKRQAHRVASFPAALAGGITRPLARRNVMEAGGNGQEGKLLAAERPANRLALSFVPMFQAPIPSAPDHDQQQATF